MQIVSEKKVDVNLDGEILPMHNPIVEILPKAMKLILPKTATENA
jgi:diacylglycerol kinase family enzyme